MKLTNQKLLKKLKTNEDENLQKIKSSQSQLKIYWFVQKKRVYNMHYSLLSNIGNSDNDLHISLFLDSKQTNRFKLGKFFIHDV